MISARWRRAWLVIGWLGLVVVIADWAAFTLLGDRVWWALPIVFGPRWLWLAPLAAIVPLAIAVPRRGIVMLAGGAVLGLLGIMDWRLGLGRLAHHAGIAITVMTLNAGAGSSVPQSPRILSEIRRVDADVVIITECGGQLPVALRALTDRYALQVGKMSSNCLLSKGTITGWWERDPRDAYRQYGSGAIQRAEVHLPQGPVRLGLVHLATPRSALEEFRDLSQIPSLGPVVRRSTSEREEEAEHAVSWIDEGGPLPLIIAGDFNTPVESVIYRRNWSRFRNAFSEVGWGTGYTKHTAWWGIRIDHILSSHGVYPIESHVGRDVGSDHLPLIARLQLPPAR